MVVATLVVAFVVVFWLVCSVFAYGLLFADRQAERSFVAGRYEREDQIWALKVAVLGPLVVHAWALDKSSGAKTNGLKFFRTGR